jgi:F420-non-reducing hydrogenase iron-sulfur subunit
MAKKTKKESKEKKNIQPRIVTFACNWCSYAGADLAGVSRMQYPATSRIIRVMCSGRITPVFILDALTDGADGVIVSGCHFSDCHYISGSKKAEKMIETTKKLMHLLGIDERRLRFELISAAEGQKFAEVTSEFTKEITRIMENGKNKK